MKTWAVVPAYNERETIRFTLNSLDGVVDDVLVVDDGSVDGTDKEAEKAGASVVRLVANRGKGHAVSYGVQYVMNQPEAGYILLADADLQHSARSLDVLIREVKEGGADLAIASFRSPGGFGLARRTASVGIRWLTGYRTDTPLSGQRALTCPAARRLFPCPSGWGLEVAMTVRALWAGLQVVEVPVELTHRATRKDWAGFSHRGRQWASIARTLGQLAWARVARRSDA